MAPHHHRTDMRPARIAADPRPVAREPEIAPRHPEMLPEPPAAPRRRPSARAARRMHARAMPMAAQAPPHMMFRMVRRGCVMDGVVEVSMRPGFCAGVRESDYASGYDKRRDQFLLHHHSRLFLGNPSPGRGWPIESPIGRENG